MYSTYIFRRLLIGKMEPHEIKRDVVIQQGLKGREQRVFQNEDGRQWCALRVGADITAFSCTH